jgi:hypothetical protein
MLIPILKKDLQFLYLGNTDPRSDSTISSQICFSLLLVITHFKNKSQGRPLEPFIRGEFISKRDNIAIIITVRKTLTSDEFSTDLQKPFVSLEPSAVGGGELFSGDGSDYPVQAAFEGALYAWGRVMPTICSFTFGKR